MPNRVTPPPVGSVFNRLTIEEVYWRGSAQARVRCECGTVKDLALSHVVRGKVKSCGCLYRETIARRNALNYARRGSQT